MSARRPLQDLHRSRSGLDHWSARTPLGSARLVVAVQRKESCDVLCYGEPNAAVRLLLAVLYDREHGVKLTPWRAEIDHR